MLRVNNNNQTPECRIYILHHKSEGLLVAYSFSKILKFSSETQRIDHHTISNRFKDLCLTGESGIPLSYVVL